MTNEVIKQLDGASDVIQTAAEYIIKLEADNRRLVKQLEEKNTQTLMSVTGVLPFSIFTDKDFRKLNVVYLGKNTKGTFLFFDPISRAVFKWNERSGYLRRNSDAAGDGRNSLCTKQRFKREDVLSALVYYVNCYRKYTRNANTRRFEYQVRQYIAAKNYRTQGDLDIL